MLWSMFHLKFRPVVQGALLNINDYRGESETREDNKIDSETLVNCLSCPNVMIAPRRWE